MTESTDSEKFLKNISEGHLAEIEAEFNDLVANLSEDADLEMSLDILLDQLLEDIHGVDKTDLAVQLGRYFERVLAKKHRIGDDKKSIDSQKLVQHLQKLAVFYNMQQSFVNQMRSTDKQQSMTNKESRKQLKEILKRAVIYESYKSMNPRKIAGETVRENFEDNVVLRGIKKAIKQEGAAASSTMSQFTTAELGALQNKHREFKKGQGR